MKAYELVDGPSEQVTISPAESRGMRVRASYSFPAGYAGDIHTVARDIASGSLMSAAVIETAVITETRQIVIQRMRQVSK